MRWLKCSLKLLYVGNIVELDSKGSWRLWRWTDSAEALLLAKAPGDCGDEQTQLSLCCWQRLLETVEMNRLSWAFVVGKGSWRLWRWTDSAEPLLLAKAPRDCEGEQTQLSLCCWQRLLKTLEMDRLSWAFVVGKGSWRLWRWTDSAEPLLLAKAPGDCGDEQTQLSLCCWQRLLETVEMNRLSWAFVVGKGSWRLWRWTDSAEPLLLAKAPGDCEDEQTQLSLCCWQRLLETVKMNRLSWAFIVGKGSWRLWKWTDSAEWTFVVGPCGSL